MCIPYRSIWEATCMNKYTKWSINFQKYWWTGMMTKKDRRCLSCWTWPSSPPILPMSSLLAMSSKCWLLIAQAISSRELPLAQLRSAYPQQRLCFPFPPSDWLIRGYRVWPLCFKVGYTLLCSSHATRLKRGYS